MSDAGEELSHVLERFYNESISRTISQYDRYIHSGFRDVFTFEQYMAWEKKRDNDWFVRTNQYTDN